MGEYTLEQRAGIQILSHAITRLITYDWPAAYVMLAKRREIYQDAMSAEILNKAYEEPPRV